MEKQTMWLIGGGLAAAGIGYYFWNKSQTAATAQKTVGAPAVIAPTSPAKTPVAAPTGTGMGSPAVPSADFQKLAQTASQMAGQAGLPTGLPAGLPAGLPSLPAGADPSVASVQNALKALGYNPGAIDGQFGQETAAALKLFQSAQNLPQTSVIDAGTVQALAAAASIGV